MMLKLSVGHFIVDFSCALFIAQLTSQHLIYYLLFYNFCAFALQMPLGILLEGRFSPSKIAVSGLIFTLLGWLVGGFPPFAILLIGIGNALFHLGGGLSIMSHSHKAQPLGLFIAPGALGIYLGSLSSLSWLVPTLTMTLLLIGLLNREKEDRPTIKKISAQHIGAFPLIFVLFFIVIIRGFSNITKVFLFEEYWLFFFILAVFLGKVIGGYLADIFGAYRVGVISLCLATICFAFPSYPLWGVMGAFFFQLTMPITLWMLGNKLPNGFAFGLLTFGLFIGSLPHLLHLGSSVPLCLLVFISLVLFAFGTRKDFNP